MFFQVVALYIGAVIGAGFASGQEILQFFIKYGQQGLWGAALVTVLFAYLGAIIMYISTKFKSSNYKELLFLLLGPISKLMDVFSLFMLVCGLAIMLAGSGAVLNQYLGLPTITGITIALISTVLVICGGVERVLSANLFLVPLKLLAVFIITILAIFHPSAGSTVTALGNNNLVAHHWLWASILYCSYNMVVPLAVMSSLGRMVTTQVGVYGGLIGGFLVGLATIMVTAAGLCFYPEITKYPVPMLFMATVVAPVLKTFFALIIWLAIITTAIADAHGFASRLAPQGGKKYKICGIAICFMVLPLAKLDFALLVKKIYPLFGYVGLILMLSLAFIPFKICIKR